MIVFLINTINTCVSPRRCVTLLSILYYNILSWKLNGALLFIFKLLTQFVILNFYNFLLTMTTQMANIGTHIFLQHVTITTCK